MTVYVHDVKRMRIYQEPNGSFATEGSIGSFLECPFVEGTGQLVLSQPTEDPNHSQQHIDGHSTHVLMPKEATLSFDLPLETFTTKATNAVQAGVGALGYLLEIAMGGEQLGTGTTISDASPGANENDLAATTGIVAGGAIGLATGAGSSLELRELESVSGSTSTTKHAFTAAPSNGATVYACASYYMDNTDGSENKSLQVAVEGLNTADRWLLSGGGLDSMRLSLPVAGRPIVSFSWKFADWDLADGSNTTMDLTAAALALATYADNVALVHADSEFRYQTVGTATIGTLIHAPEINFEPNITYVPHKTSAGTNTVKQWVRGRSHPVISGSFVCPFEDSTWFDRRDAKTLTDFMLQIGTSTTNGGALIVAPNTQITDVQLINQDGLSSQRVSWVGRLDTDAGSSTDVQLSAFRIHLA